MEAGVFDRAAWRARQAEWDRFHQWEAEHPIDSDLATAWRWYEELYELGRRLGEAEPEIDMDRIHHLTLIHDRLARLPWPK